MHSRGYVPERVLVVMALDDGAAQLVAALRELGSSIVELAGDHETVVSRCSALQPELVLLDVEHPEALQLAAAVHERSRAPLVYVCLADADPAPELVALCSAGIERPVTQARLRRCLSGLSAAAREHTASAMSELLASVAHELRAPLQGVSGFARYLLDGKAGPMSDEQTLCLQQVELGTQHVLQLVEDALELTDGSVATREAQSEPLDVEQALRAVVQVLQPLAIKRQIAIDLKVDDPVHDAVLDASKLKQVIYNVISVSLRDARSAGALSIRLTAKDAAAFCVEVRDSGPGLTQPMLERLNAAHAHAGISSWASAQQLLAALGGRLHAFNDKPSGAVFRVELPRRPSAKRPYLRSV